jgi:hypothetical protein
VKFAGGFHGKYIHLASFYINFSFFFSSLYTVSAHRKRGERAISFSVNRNIAKKEQHKYS